MRYLLFLSFLSLVMACRQASNSSDNNAATALLQTEFYVRYLETEQQIKAYASFTYGDSLPALQTYNFLKGVQFQGQEMKGNPLPDRSLRYVYNGNGDFAMGGFSFVYEDPSSKQRSILLKIDPILDFSLPSASISKGLNLTLQSAAFQVNESLVLLFLNEKNQAFSTEIKGPFDTQSMQLATAQLNGISPGKHFLYLVRRQLNKSQENNLLMTSEIEFYTKTIEVKIDK